MAEGKERVSKVTMAELVANAREWRAKYNYEPCACRGSNELCRDCDGTGYKMPLDDDDTDYSCGYIGLDYDGDGR